MDSPPTISVCVPYYDKPPEFLRLAVTSALAGLPPNGEVLVLCDGEKALSSVGVADLPPSVRILGSSEPLGLVANWNRGLASARGELIHVLHDDDAVAHDFYEAIFDLHQRHPNAALYATNFTYFRDRPAAGPPLRAPVPPKLISGEEAAEFLLRQGSHTCGSVVLAAWAVRTAGPFDAAFPHCPDEEAYLRYAQRGGIAFDSRPLYHERMHPLQERFRTWRRSDFVAMYMAARVQGASYFGPKEARRARDLTARNVVRLALMLTGEGDPQAGVERLDDLARTDREFADRPGFRVARRICASRSGARLLRLAVSARRAVRAYRSGSQPHAG